MDRVNRGGCANEGARAFRAGAATDQVIRTVVERMTRLIVQVGRQATTASSRVGGGLGPRQIPSASVYELQKMRERLLLLCCCSRVSIMGPHAQPSWHGRTSKRDKFPPMPLLLDPAVPSPMHRSNSRAPTFDSETAG